MKDRILELLKENGDSFLSGQRISGILGISRSAIWKHINLLRDEGYQIESYSKKGYRLTLSPDVLSATELDDKLNTKFIGRKIYHFDTIDSTNLKAKELASLGEGEGSVVISEEQTSGKGRLGRHWISPKYKGIWMSIILRPDINPVFASKVTLIGAAAVFKAMEQMGIGTLIKWPNDIIVNSKKVCGILTEMSAELNKIHYLVIGIGINVNVDEYDFSDDVKLTGTSLKLETGRTVDRKLVTAGILNNFELLYTEFLNDNSAKTSIDICRANSVLLGKEIKIVNAGREITAKAIDINPEGELLIEHDDGTVEVVFSGEVSLRGLSGYV